MEKQETTTSSTGKIIQIDEARVRDHLAEIVRGSVEETLNTMLQKEADELCQARRYERKAERVSTRAGTYERKLETKAGEVTLRMPKLRSVPFETAIIERYRRRESSVEEALIEMYLAGVSVRRVEDITEALWGTRVSPSTVSELNQKIHATIQTWRERRIDRAYTYVFLDGIYLKRSWGGEVRNVSVLVAIGVGADGFREILGVAEGIKEDKSSWSTFLRSLKERGLEGVKMFTSDRCLGLVESLADFYPDALWQRCTVHFYRNVFSLVPSTKVREVAAMLKAIHAQEARVEAIAKIEQVAVKLDGMKLGKAAELVRKGAVETLSYYAFPEQHWRRIRTNNPMERIMREIRRRTRVVGCFPDGNSALMLVAARLRHIAGTKWGSRLYLDMKHFQSAETQEALAAG